MRKPAFCICENKDADQLRGNREADQRLCFRYIASTIPLLLKIQNFKPLTIFYGCTAQFVSDLVGKPEDRFSHIEVFFYSNQEFNGRYIISASFLMGWLIFEPHSEKNDLRDFRPGLTQTGLYSHRRWLDAGNFGFRKKRDCSICVANRPGVFVIVNHDYL